MIDKNIRKAFSRRFFVLVNVASDGFEIRDDHYAHLTGRVRKVTLARKLFEDHMLVCSSRDGLTGSEGRVCDQCRHPSCQPRLRIQLEEDSVVYVLDLPSSSADNFFRIMDEAEKRSERLQQWRLKLSVVNHGYWGEVTFERISP